MTNDTAGYPANGRIEPTANEVERQAFQDFLDDHFPIGAICAVITSKDSHLDSTAEAASGRLLCSGVERDDTEQWWHELVIDSRGSEDGETEILKVWVREPRRHRGGAHLWEAEVRTGGAGRGTLRLNADPPQPWRPTLRMRKAVTAAYAERWPATVSSP